MHGNNQEGLFGRKKVVQSFLVSVCQVSRAEEGGELRGPCLLGFPRLEAPLTAALAHLSKPRRPVSSWCCQDIIHKQERKGQWKAGKWGLDSPMGEWGGSWRNQVWRIPLGFSGWWRETSGVVGLGVCRSCCLGRRKLSVPGKWNGQERKGGWRCMHGLDY